MKKAKKKAKKHPCMPLHEHFDVGQKWEVVNRRGGHVFCWRVDTLPDRPGIQYACCIGCGRAYHTIYPAVTTKKGRES